ncbi:HAMP domain-containing sensor histidine kinase [Xenophilus arseniciresistens]|uniref:histidine kinase n=1 Tax=Xenophilus arseniciresistens TaxID=1283306 RepID=A0AAE3N6J0_9BURK|nr:HAMP domain-containing sensor histidine kinase [Xenophilus arseniciresistens]MDA7414867.1 HAMP domain-containing sensor histidine kinase [Xenophilus arseniciresistens]
MQRPRNLAARLARTLILWVGGTWLVCVLAVAWYVDREIDVNFDNELVEVSHRMFDIALREYEAAPAEAKAAATPIVAPPPLFAQDEVLYQLLDDGGRVLLRTTHAATASFDVPLAPGFDTSQDWRIYTVRHPSRALYMQVADPLAERREAVMRTLTVLIAALVAVLPLLALGLRHIARRELLALADLTTQVGQRSGSDLRPLQLQGLPDELHTLGEGVNSLLERLAHALQVERALAANAAHELRTPLAAARLRLQTALEHGLDRAEVQAALEALQTLSHRTEKLLQLSRAESGAALARAPVDLARLAATVAEEFWRDAGVAARLDLQLDEALQPPQAQGDVDALAIALRNLVENALRYAGDARIELAVQAPATLVVRDFGPGVSAANLATLRQRHVRHSADQAGYGLGLSIVGTIVQQHGGRLSLTSPPAGATQGFEARIELQR